MIWEKNRSAIDGGHESKFKTQGIMEWVEWQHFENLDTFLRNLLIYRVVDCFQPCRLESFRHRKDDSHDRKHDGIHDT